VKWIELNRVLAIHDEQIAEHGGPSGVGDIGLLESALARPQHLAHYGKPDIADLAACYAAGIAKNHAFNDGNKRTAAVVMELFLAKNGYSLNASDQGIVSAIRSIASGRIPEAELAEWIREYLAGR